MFCSTLIFAVIFTLHLRFPSNISYQCPHLISLCPNSFTSLLNFSYNFSCQLSPIFFLSFPYQIYLISCYFLQISPVSHFANSFFPRRYFTSFNFREDRGPSPNPSRLGVSGRLHFLWNIIDGSQITSWMVFNSMINVIKFSATKDYLSRHVNMVSHVFELRVSGILFFDGDVLHVLPPTFPKPPR